eukprot:scaffold1192_cov209-Chaetoceros_neogracile.AAC.3
MPNLDSIADFAALVPRITGSISVLSSSMIFFLIYRSQAKLSSIYHQIMFGMSVADVMASIAMALTTIPMPRNDDAQYWIELYNGNAQWEEQTKFGNKYSCAAQGFFSSTGFCVAFAYHASLCAYYACAIALRMQEKDIHKKVAPFLLGLPPILGLAVTISALVNSWYKVITNEAWCTLYPFDTGRFNTKILQISLLAGITCLFVIIITSFALIIWRVRKNGKLLAQASNCDHIQVENRVTAAHRNTKLIIAQSLAYIGSLAEDPVLFSRLSMLEIHDNMVEAVAADEFKRNIVFVELDDPSEEENTTGNTLSRMELSNKDDFSRS